MEVKWRMKGIARKVAAAAIAAAVVFGSVQAAGFTAEANKTAYMAVRFDGKSNWSKLVKVSGKAGQVIVTYHLQCQCGKEWTNHTGFAELSELWGQHTDKMSQKAYDDASCNEAGSGNDGEVVSVEDLLNIGAGVGRHAGYKTWYTTGTSN